MARCTECGAPIEGNICEYCGSKRDIEIPQQPQYQQQNYQTENPQIIFNLQPPPQNISTDGSNKNKCFAFLLCFFLGFFGVHNFYVGKTTLGLVYLFTGGLCGIGWFIDMILIATGNFKDSKGLKLK